MHIVQLLNSRIPSGDGIVTHVLGLAERLRGRGHQVTLVTRSSSGRQEEKEYEGSLVIGAPFFPLYPFHVQFHSRFVRRVLRELRPQPDLVHLHMPLAPFPGREWPVVTTFHTPMLVDTSYISGRTPKAIALRLMGRTTSYWIECDVLRQSDVVLTVSPAVAEDLRSQYGFQGLIHTVLNAVDLDFYCAGKPETSTHDLLYVGRLSYRKGLVELVRSSVSVARAFPAVRYHIVGSGPFESRLKLMVEQLNVEENFVFHGEVRDRAEVRRHYRNARAVLIPSHYEGLPMTLVEAMACSKAVVSTTAAFTNGFVEHRRDALLVEPGSAAELAEATLELLGSDELCDGLGKAARKTVERVCDPTRNTDAIEAFYSNAMSISAPAAR